jgi:class 3 adenylate cyclase
MRGTRKVLIAGLLALPLAGLALLLAVPSLDVRWEHQPSHFWLVFTVAVVNVVLGVMAGVVADRHGDRRLFLVSQVLLMTAGFLGLHALATPGVVLDSPNLGFAIATPVGMVLAAPLAFASTPEVGDALPPWAPRVLRLVVAALVLGWGAASLMRVSLLDQPPQEELPGVLQAAVVLAMALYVLAARPYIGLHRSRRRSLPLAVAVTFVLLAEAMVAMLFGRSWHASWWEWHLLMTIAFAIVLAATRAEYRRERSVTEAFRSLYLDRTLERIDDRSSAGLRAFVEARERGEPTAAVAERLRREGLGADEVRALERSAVELARVDDLFHRYVGPRLADTLTERPDLTGLGGREVQVTVLFADLAGFTSFSEGRTASETIHMLNAYWAAVVPAITGDAGGMIDRFAGDAVIAVFNALGDQPDHALRAARAALGMRDAVAPVAADHPDWPRFRIGLHAGPAVIGNVGTAEQHSFTAIGDTVNTAARVQGLADTGEVLVSGAVWDRIADAAVGRRLAPTQVKGRREAVELHRLERLA